MTATRPSHNTLTVTTPSDLEIVMTRDFDAPRRLVWAAHTSTEHIPRWLLGPDGWEMPECQIDLRPGGTWRYGWRNAKGKEMHTGGRFIEVVPIERIVQTEAWEGEGPESVVTLRFDEEDGRTRLTQTMRFPTREIRDMVLQTGMDTGVSRSYERLDGLLPTMD